ncbi:hypothetical protein OHC33_009035 [Knufia fluminis]|uniref:Asl1-like glycosyl hydrolase catalytic domain-containing protein n=1 Tax=Knufia fluminis TaxID=191047 RepID=A0AAN8I4F2_9EURO|nr:hypothetical protein OHC33_009035 [Knufia fluminis]
MQSKTLALFALSASAALATPFHKRADFQHHSRHQGTGYGTGNAGVRPTGTGRPFPAGNDTEGVYAPTGDYSILPVSNTFGNVATDSSCESTSTATETSTNFVTVTASAADIAETKVIEGNSVSAGAFYGQSRTRGGNWGESSAPAATGSYSMPSSVVSSAATDSFSMPSSDAPSASNPSTTFATMTSASKSSGASASVSASASASASAVAPPTGSSGGKRGISFNDASLVSAFGSAVSWSYNWGATAPGTIGNGVEFVPMMWGRNDVDSFASKVGSATHVLSFNEPDLAEQAGIDAQTAADLHKQGMADLVGKVQIGSPAVTNGANGMGVDWLDAFFTACGKDCPVDFVAYHWYATADSIDYFEKHTQDVIDVANKYGISKVWLTEFKPEGSADAQAAFMKQAVPFLDGKAEVERYAAFMASEGTMLTGGKLNSLGSAYAGTA